MQMCLLFSIGPVFYIVSSLVAGKLTDILVNEACIYQPIIPNLLTFQGARYLMCAGLILVDISFLLIGPAPFISDHRFVLSIVWGLILISLSIVYCG